MQGFYLKKHQVLKEVLKETEIPHGFGGSGEGKSNQCAMRQSTPRTKACSPEE